MLTDLPGENAAGRDCRGMRRALAVFASTLATAAFPCALAAVNDAPAPAQHAAALEMIVLGSGGPGALGRASSSYLVLLDGKPRILVDCGPGSFARLGEAHVTLDDLDSVLLTHLHVDHAAELPGIVKARAVSAGRPIKFDVFGPSGREASSTGGAPFPATSRFMELLFSPSGAFAYLKDFSAPVSFRVTDLPVSSTDNRSARVIVRDGALSVSAISGHHGDAPAVIYRIDYGDRSIVFSGDVDAHGLGALRAIARGASLLVFHAVVLDPPDSPEVLYSLHTPPEAIGETANDAHVEALLLSHLSPAVDDNRATVTSSIARHYHGHVTFAGDGMHIQP